MKPSMSLTLATGLHAGLQKLDSMSGISEPSSSPISMMISAMAISSAGTDLSSVSKSPRDAGAQPGTGGDGFRVATVLSEHAVRIGAGDVRGDPGGRILRIPDELQRIPMLDGPSVGAHLVNVDPANPRVIGVIRQQIHKIHVSEYVVADGDDPMDDNVSARMG